MLATAAGRGSLLTIFCSVALGFTAGCTTPTGPAGVDAQAVPVTDLQSSTLWIASPTQAIASDKLAYSIGVNTHLSYFRTAYGTGWSTIVKPAILALGVKHLRDGGVVVSDDRWMSLVYGRMQDLASSGVKFVLVMRPAEGSTDYQHLPQFDRLLQYAGPAAEAFEGLNEHDVSGRSQWPSEVEWFQRALYAKVKSDPRTAAMPVFGPTFAHPKNASQVGDLSASLDVGAIHPYPGGLEPLATVATHRNAVRPVVGAHPWVASETGYHTTRGWTGSHPAVSERAMAVYVMRTPFEYLRAGLRRVYFYELIDQGTAPDREDHFGLLRADGSPKPAYTALRRIITLLKDPGPGFTPGTLSYVVSGGGSTVRHMLFQKRDGRFYLALWQTVSSYDVRTGTDLTPTTLSLVVQLEAPARMRVYAPLTSDSPIADRPGVASIGVALSDAPLLVEITP